jgi:hypothetical protein
MVDLVGVDVINGDDVPEFLPSADKLRRISIFLLPNCTVTSESKSSSVYSLAFSLSVSGSDTGSGLANSGGGGGNGASISIFGDIFGPTSSDSGVLISSFDFSTSVVAASSAIVGEVETTLGGGGAGAFSFLLDT